VPNDGVTRDKATDLITQENLEKDMVFLSFGISAISLLSILLLIFTNWAFRIGIRNSIGVVSEADFASWHMITSTVIGVYVFVSALTTIIVAWFVDTPKKQKREKQIIKAKAVLIMQFVYVFLVVGAATLVTVIGREGSIAIVIVSYLWQVAIIGVVNFIFINHAAKGYLMKMFKQRPVKRNSKNKRRGR